MIDRTSLRAGHPPTPFAAFLYCDIGFMVWVMLGPLGLQIATELHLDPAQKGLMVAMPILAGAMLRFVNGVRVDRIGAQRTGVIGHRVDAIGRLTGWLISVIRALVAVIGLTSIKARWRTTWGAMPGVARS